MNSKEFADAYANRFHIVDGENEGMDLRTTAEIALAVYYFTQDKSFQILTVRKFLTKIGLVQRLCV